MDFKCLAERRTVASEALSSVPIGVLMRGYANYKARGGEIKLCSLGRRIKDLFTMTKLIMVFDHHDTEEHGDRRLRSRVIGSIRRTGPEMK